MMKYAVILQGEQVDPAEDVTDVIVPTMLRAECWRVAIGMIGTLNQAPRVRFWVTPMLDFKTSMTIEERESFALGWYAREVLSVGHPIPLPRDGATCAQPQASAHVKRDPC